MPHSPPPHIAARFLAAILYFGIGLPFSALDARSEDQAETRDAIETWVRDMGLVMGSNPAAQAFVVRGGGKDQLECLVAALVEFTAYLETDASIVDTNNDGEAAARLFTLKSLHCLRGYDIQHEQVSLKQIVSGDNKTGTRRNNKHEAVTLVTKDGALVCAAFIKRNDQEHTHAFYPSLATARRQAVEHELMETFVRDSFTYRFAEDSEILGVFVIDCSPR
jgi:hypothetical protein